MPELSWYLPFTACKLPIILEGIHLRFEVGETGGPVFNMIGGLVTPLVRAGRRSLVERTVGRMHER